MEQAIIEKISQTVYKQFPYLKDSTPVVTEQQECNFLLVYKGSASTADGHTLPVSVRVVTDPLGKILKITSSR